MWYPKHSKKKKKIRGQKKGKKDAAATSKCLVIRFPYAEDLSYAPFGHCPASLDAGLPVRI